MDANATKIVRKFKLEPKHLTILLEAGLDTPRKIKAAARADKLPYGVKTKLARWTK